MTRLWKRIAIIALVGVGTLGGWYAAVAYRYWNNPPKLSRNFAAELNAPIQEVPLNQRAWPVYRDALLEIERLPSELYRTRFAPWRNADDPRVAPFVRRHEASLAKVRAATRLPAMGYPLSDGEPPADTQVRSRTADPPLNIDPLAASDNPILLNVRLTPAAEVGDLVELLAVDAILAARDGDGKRTADDLAAMIGIAEHLRQTPCSITDGVSASYFSRALRTWGYLMTSAPDAFDDKRLGQLEAAVRNYAGGKLKLHFEFARAMFLDAMQRIYTDNGAEDGYFYAPASAELGFELDPTPRWRANLGAPFTKTQFHGRRASVAQFERLLQLAVADTDRPLWKCTDWPHRDAIDQLRTDPRWGIVNLFASSYDQQHGEREQVVQQRDAMLTASALLRYRRRHGDWPTTLRELIPEFLPTMPVDRLNGRPLSYLRTVGAEPVLYSVGTDLDDDGGRPALVAADDDNLGRNETVRLPLHWDFTTYRHAQPEGDLILWPVLSTEELSHQPPQLPLPRAKPP